MFVLFFVLCDCQLLLSSFVCQRSNKSSINSEEFIKTMSFIMAETNFSGSFTGFLTQKAVNITFYPINTFNVSVEYFICMNN